MFDGIKVQDVSVDVAALLKNDRLTFGELVDTQTGFILSPIRRTQDRGLNFQLIPRRTQPGHRVEVKGSLHKFYNNGLHNADQYTADDLLVTLKRLVTDYGFDLFGSKISNIEFGVNLELPFPTSQVFDNLICHKNQPFQVDSQSQTPYYACHWQRYSVKVYDKGKQKELGCNLLRFEIRVRKMQYFNGTGVRLRTLADLLNVANYGPLGALLIGTFNEILFDDPAINPKNMTPRERKIYQDGRNPRYWQTPDVLTPQQATAHRQRLSRDKKRYRALLAQHGGNWQGEVAALIEQTWNQLTTVDDQLLMNINQYRAIWQEQVVDHSKSATLSGAARPPGCHKLTDNDLPVNTAPDATARHSDCHKLTAPSTPGLSQINPLYSEVHCVRGTL